MASIMYTAFLNLPKITTFYKVNYLDNFKNSKKYLKFDRLYKYTGLIQRS